MSANGGLTPQSLTWKDHKLELLSRPLHSHSDIRAPDDSNPSICEQNQGSVHPSCQNLLNFCFRRQLLKASWKVRKHHRIMGHPMSLTDGSRARGGAILSGVGDAVADERPQPVQAKKWPPTLEDIETKPGKSGRPVPF